MLVPQNSFSGSSISGVTAVNEALESHFPASRNRGPGFARVAGTVPDGALITQ